MKIFFLLLIVLFSSKFTTAADSTRTLSLSDFLQIVKTFHPVAKQANLNINKASASLTTAWGGFNPLLNGNGNNKTFDGINYYSTNALQLSIPAWYGIEFNIGIEYLQGSKTDPQQTIGKTSYAGLSVPLLKNLIIDKRRASLKQAMLMVKASEYERRKMVNDLIMDATEIYWNWAQSYFIYKTYFGIIEINKKRVNMVKTAYSLGERPAIDTTEALAQLQQFEYQQNEALANWQNATILLNNFLWKENNEPYELPDNVTTDKKVEELFDAVTFPDIETLISEVKRTHPELNLFAYKLKNLSIEKKLKFQELLPGVNLKYNQLGKGYDITSTVAKATLNNNYRFGFSVSIPLLLSQGRGEYKLAKIKITETSLQQGLKEIEIVSKLKSYYNQLVNYKSQVNLLQKNYSSYALLQQGEETKFLKGEGSLFLINSRENKSLETLLKLTETTIKYNKVSYALKWASGELWKL